MIRTGKKFGLEVWDLGLILCMILLIGVGLLSIYSVSQAQAGTSFGSNFLKQVYWFFLGIVLFLVAFSIHPRYLEAFAYPVYGLAILSLLAVLVIGKTGGGAARWISFGGIRFQPSEWAKLATVLALAKFLSDHHDTVNQTRNLLLAAVIGVLPMLLVAKQPDLGTALVFAAILPAVLYWGGVKLETLILAVLPFATAVASFNVWTFFGVMAILVGILIYARKPPLVSGLLLGVNIAVGIFTPYLWQALHPYQQKRVLAFLGLVQDPRGISYQVIQSKVAIGSGGLWGKGFLHGTQTQLRFLPEQHTDFIFSVIGEEFGFVGGMVILLLFSYLLMRGVRIAASAKNRFYGLVAIGIVSIFFYHYFVNLGMAMGIMPVTGLPLPFVSYGGTFLTVSMASVGLLVGISRRKHEY